MRRPRARAPRRRTPRRDARSRGTCRGSRRRATAAPCRPAARPRRRRPPPPRSVAARSIVQTPAQHRRERRRVLADQHRVPDLAAERRGERREILALALAAGDQHQRSAQARQPPRWSRRRWCPSNHRRSARPPTSATHWPSGAAGPGRLRARCEHRGERSDPAASPSASAASALAALCRPADLHARRAASRGSPRRASELCAPRRVAGRSPRRARAIEKLTRAPRRGPRASRRPGGSSAFSTIVGARARRSAPWPRAYGLDRPVAVHVVRGDVEHRGGR